MQKINSPLAWKGDELARRKGWQHVLSPSEIDEIEAALVIQCRKNPDPLATAAEDFPLPRLGDRLRAARESLEHDLGSFLLRGWPVEHFPIEDNTRVFWGLSRHLGTPISQSAGGEKVFRVEDAGFGSGHPKARGPNTSKGLHFHCDRCDVIGFLCVRQALEGGESYLVSSLSVYNEILTRRPDLLAELCEPWYYKTHNVDTSNPDRWCRQPIFAFEQGQFVGYVLRVLIDRAYELPDLPELTPAQKEALDFLDQVCAEPELHHHFRQEPGDLLYVNNFVNFHSRSAFVDHPAREQKRLLLRIWLSMPNSRALPAAFAGSFGRTEAGALRGGIHPPGKTLGL